MTSARYVYDVMGRNYRMTNIQAALLYDQLEHLDSIRRDKHAIFRVYQEHLKDTTVIPRVEEGTVPSEWMFVCGLKDIRYEELEAYMKSYAIDIRPFFYDISVHTHLNNIRARPLGGDVTYFMLPSYPDLTLEQVKHICQTVNGFTRPVSN